MDGYSKFWYYQLDREFFRSAAIRRLRRKFGSDGVIIYLQLILLSITDDGYIECNGMIDNESFIEELAFDIQEEGNEDLISEVLAYCIRLGLIVSEVEGNLLYIPDVTGKVKTLSPSGRRMRKKRAEEKARTKDEISSAQSDAHCADININSNSNSIELYQEQEQELEQEKERDIALIFENVWKVYPVQQSKDRTCREFAKQIQAGWDPEELLKAAVNYSEQCRLNNVKDQYVIRPWNFFGSNQAFKDYINPDNMKQGAADNGNRHEYNLRADFFG